MENDNEKIYTIPLRDAWKGAYKYRAKKSIFVIREFVKRHAKTENVKIGQELNQEIWENGRKNPPRKVKVQVVSHDGAMWVELQGVKINFPKKKEEKKEEAAAEEKAPETKEEKIEAPKEKEPEQEKKEAKEHNAKAPEEKKAEDKKSTESQTKLKKDTDESKARKPSKKSPSTKAKPKE